MIRYVSKAERNTAAYNEAAVGQTTQGDYWVQKMAVELGSDAPAAGAAAALITSQGRPGHSIASRKNDGAQIEGGSEAARLVYPSASRALTPSSARWRRCGRPTPSRGLVTQADKPKPGEKEEPDLLAQLLAKEEKPADHLEQVTRKPMERRRPSVENNSTYQTVLEMCLAGDAGEPEDAKEFGGSTSGRNSASPTRRTASYWRDSNRMPCGKLHHRNRCLNVPPKSARAAVGLWLAERRRKSFELDNTKALMLAASQGNHLGQIRAALAEGERLGLVGFASFECIEAEACLAARHAAEAQERRDDLERAHKDKFAFDYGRRDDLAL